MNAAAIDLRGGVSPRGTLLRGQSIIEYVLIIAIIGLAIVFAGPGVAGAIRNQFDLVGNTVNSGTSGGTESGSDSSTVSGAVQAAIAKDAKDWTLAEQNAVAEDIAKNGESSKVYAKAKAAMDTGTTWSMKLTNDKTMTYRIIGINHDDLADGSGKAGLTFEITNDAMGKQCMNATDTTAGGWEKSELRGRLNSGDLWSMLPSRLVGKIKAVKKMTGNKGGGSVGAPTPTTDRIFLLSSTEIWGNLDSDGFQYEYFKDMGVTKSNISGSRTSYHHWTRSLIQGYSTAFRFVDATGDWCPDRAADTCYVLPAFCF